MILEHPLLKTTHIEGFLSEIKKKSDTSIHYFLIGFFIIGLALSFYYDTWLVAAGVGTLSLTAYYSAKIFLPKSDLYQYVLSAVFGIFMAQFIYEMHGLFEMHFLAFIGSAILITYQNWKLQIPLAVVVFVHHALFAYLQFVGYDKVYFTQLDFMSLQTFAIHISLAILIFFICGLWAYQFKKYSESHIDQSFEIGKLQEERIQKLALFRSEHMFREFFESAPEAILVQDLDTKRYIDVNANAQHLFKYTREELLSKTPCDLSVGLQPDGRNSYNVCMESIGRAAAGEKVIFEWEQIDGDGKAFMSEVRLTKLSVPGRNLLRASIIDITEKKIAEKKLAEANRELNLLFNNVDEVLFTVDIDHGLVTHMSSACEKVYGYKPDEFISDAQLWLKVIHPDDNEIIEDQYARIMQGCEVQNQYRIINKDNSVRWVENIVMPTMDKERKVTRLDGVTRDITARKAAEDEIKALNGSLEMKVNERTSELLQVNKELEAFSYSVSHDLRAPLRVIDGFGRLLMETESAALSDDGKDHLDVILKNAKQMGCLVDDLLSFSRLGRTPVTKEPLHMKNTVEGVISEVRSFLELSILT